MVIHGYMHEAQFMKKVLVLIFKVTGGFLGLCLLVGIVWLFIDFHRYQVYHDPVHVPNLSEYLAYYGKPKNMHRVKVEGVEFYGLRASIGNFAVTVSGPPVFLYGKDGQLWDYTLNSGDADFAHGGFGMGEIEWMETVAEPVLAIQKIMVGKE
jgi:hypothetical protein